MSASDDPVFFGLLNVRRVVNGIPLVKPSNPINFGRLGALIGLGTFARTGLGLASIPRAAGQGVVDIVTGIRQFVTALVLTPVVGMAGLIRAAFASVGLSQFGPLALPLAVGVTMASLYVALVGFRQAADLLGGGG